MHVFIPVLHRPTRPTGICRYAANLALCLSYKTYVSQITLIVGNWQVAYFKQAFNLESPKIEVISVDIRNTSLSRNYWFMFELPKLAQQIKPDIIHMSFPFPFVRYWFKSSVISTIHDLYPYECPENFGYPQVWFNKLFLRQCIYSSDALVCVSECTLEVLKNYFPQVKKSVSVAVIYNIVSFDDIKPRKPKELGAASSDSFILTVAQHRKNKNLNLLIQAYSQLLHSKKLNSNTYLILVGSPGPETEYLKNLVQSLELNEQIHFLSGIGDEELYWLYTHASLFVIPSSAEGFCLPLAEALTLSCRTVCSDIPIFREVGSTKCHYFRLDENALNNLLEAITIELSSKRLHERNLDCRFSKQLISSQILNFYESLSKN